ncbi:MAG TPA: SEC-C domain-containing protein [Clostridia bacterium]|nr:SEC-C domain-containing protein [Clostridia bacterium]
MNRLQKSIEQMKRYYPQFPYSEYSAGMAVCAVWRGSVQPITPREDMEHILDDIAHERTVRIVGGNIGHHPNCSVAHCRHDWMDSVTDISQSFELEVRWDGTARHPACWVLSPAIPPEKRRHMWADGSLCVFYASEGVWDHRENDVVDFMDHVPIWLAKWQVFNRTGVWIGREHYGDPRYHINTIKPSQQCWCRSGRKYVKCHMREDSILALRM